MDIGLDFDGVVADLGKLKSETARRLYGIEIPSGRFKKDFVVGGGLLTAEQYKSLQDHIYRNREIGLLLEPVEGALDYLSLLQEEGHRIRIITSRGVPESGIVGEWMHQRRLHVPVTYVGFGNDKAGACRGLDAYVDDDLDKLEKLVGIVPHRFLFSWEYNRHLQLDAKVAVRVEGWEEFYERVKEIRQ